MSDIKKDILWRVILLYALVFIIALAIIARVIVIQFPQGKEWKEKAIEEKVRFESVEAQRGNIYDCQGNILVSSIPIFDLRMDAASTEISDDYFYAHVDSLAWYLSDLFKDRTRFEYLKEMKNARESGNRYYLLKRKITYEELNKVRRFPIFRLGRYGGGLIVEEHTRREMPYDFLASRTIGYHSEEAKAYVGLEGAYNKQLQGTGGQRLVKKIASGIWVPVSEEYDLEPQHGDDLITTLDIVLQDVTEHALLKQLTDHEAEHGCAVLMEVRTGYVRAIANLGRNQAGSYEEDYNYAIAEGAEPGSVFKLASMLAVLDDQKVNLSNTVYTGNGSIQYANRTMRDVHPIGDGSITVREAFEHSSNVGISKIIWDAYQGNPGQFTDRLYAIGLNKPLGIELAGEASPLIKNPGSPSWSRVTLPWMSVGYEVKLSPLQILTLYNAVANNGKMLRPAFVQEIRRSGKTVQSFEPVVLNHSICSQKTIHDLRTLLEGVVENGTGKSLNDAPYRIAGKTGTAQIADNDAGYNKKNYKATFVGYFPAEDPVYSCIVVVTNPSKGVYYGSQIAAPVFREIADKVYATQLAVRVGKEFAKDTIMLPDTVRGYQPDLKTIFATLDQKAVPAGFDTAWAMVYREKNRMHYQGIAVTDTAVPDFRGMGARDAVFLIESLGMKPCILGKGKVTNQSLPPGSRLLQGEAIILTLSPNQNLPPENDTTG
ncbi:MAG: penicillin-binding protein [Bacteroidales bacterium]|nr:transpeptidase family protein [Lentimicrobiaceae bacterium]MDD5694180.1 penicillin-binding protein [Bacteroidales bacterium]